MKAIIIVVLSTVMMTSCAIFNGGESLNKVVEIKTSAQCGDCKERIENKLNYVSGVKYAELNIETQFVEVKYNEKKISLSEIKGHLNDIGYHADDQKAPKESIEKLPMCCQPGGHGK